MEPEQRHDDSPIPAHFETYLTDDQIRELRKMEGFGWQLKFNRRPLFKPAIVILVNHDNDDIGVLEEDGTLNMEPDIVIRH